MDALEKVFEWGRENVLSVVFGGLGLILLGVGLMQMKTTGELQEVKVIPVKEERVVQTLVVDVAGAVEKPGVFEMDEGVRVADALVAAGGLSVEADRDWVARFVNQAEPVRDGMKIFIPLEGEKGTVTGEGGSVGSVGGSGSVNVNTASMAELDELWGIGEARAKDIVDNRPYGSIEELRKKAGIPENVLEKNEGKMSVY